MERKHPYLAPAILATVFVIAAVITVVVAAMTDKGNVLNGLQSVLLTAPDSSEYRFDADSQRSEAQIFSDLISGAEKTETDLSAVTVPIYRIEYTYVDRIERYTLCTVDTEDTYYVYLTGEDGTVLRATRETSAVFLSTGYGENAFASAPPPALYTSAEDCVTPSAMTWYFLGNGQEYRCKQQVDTTSKQVTYYQNGYVGFRFSIQPDDVHITIGDETKILFDGTPEELVSSDLSYSGKLQVRIRAEWEQKQDSPYYGQAEYAFNLEYVAPAVFTPSSATAEQGGFLFVRCENILDSSKIKSRMMNDDSCDIRFFTYGDQTYGVITVASDSKTGNKTVRCTYGGVTTDITFTVTESSYTPQIVPYSVPEEKLSSCSSAAEDGFFRLYQSLCNEDTVYLFLGESFTPPVSDATPTVCFGDTVAPDGTTRTFVSGYAEYAVEAGASVTAINGGVVYATGYDDFFGNYVVIGHGGGVQTWYGHLSGISVRTGDTVSRGDLIGIAGNSGFASGNSVAVCVSVCGRLVDPRLLFDQGYFSVAGDNR